MNKAIHTSCAAAFLFCGAVLSAYDRPQAEPSVIRSENNGTVKSYGASAIDARFNISVKDSTDTVRFIRDNINPFVITKAYLLQNANPFAVRCFLKRIIDSKMVKANKTNVDAIQFMDGKGMVIVSAEDYRFKDTPNADGFDTIIRKLDRKDLGYYSAYVPFAYFPKMGIAANLRDMLVRFAATPKGKEMNLDACSIHVDPWLNALMFNVPPFALKNVQEMLKSYDIPVPEVRITYRVIELYQENDDKVGIDFQSWKNNDGMDLFSVGGRYRRNWSSYFTGGPTPNGRNKTSWINFNPKWNTRYVDLTSSKSNAKVLSSGTILLKNRETSQVTVNMGFFADRTDAVYWDPSTDIGNLPYRQTIAQVIPADKLAELASDANGYLIYTYNNARVMGQLTSTPAYAIVDKTLLNAKLSGQDVPSVLSPSVLQTNTNTNYVKGVTNSDTNNGNVGLYEGKPQFPVAEEGFQFDMRVNAIVTDRAAMLDLDLKTISLIGYNSDGTSRRSNSSFSTNIQVGYDGEEFVIGGLSKSEVVRSVSGLPWLKDIPILGFLFCDESESMKRSQIIVTLTAQKVGPDDKIQGAEESTIGTLVSDIDKGLKSPVNNLGFQQLLIDTDEVK